MSWRPLELSESLLLLSGCIFFIRINNIIPLLGALALGAQKLLPLIQQVYAGWANINGNSMVLKDVINLLNTKAKPMSKIISEKLI